jgi:uncharacterized membrane protein SirB2
VWSGSNFRCPQGSLLWRWIGKAVAVEKTVLFFHLLGALVFVAGIVLAAAAFEAARRRDRVEEVALHLSLTQAGAKLVAFGGLLLFVCGLWLVELADIGFGTGWVTAAMTLFVIAVVLGGSAASGPSRRASWRPGWQRNARRGPRSCGLSSTIPSRGSRTTPRAR